MGVSEKLSKNGTKTVCCVSLVSVTSFCRVCGDMFMKCLVVNRLWTSLYAGKILEPGLNQTYIYFVQS